MPGSTDIQAFVLKIEASYGVDATPVAATDAILLRSPKLTPLDAKLQGRDLVSAAMGNGGDLVVGAMMKVEGEIEFAGSGAAGTAPRWGVLARVCGMAQVLTALTDVQYNPVSSNFESATGYYFYAGKKHVMKGVRGSLSGSLTAEGIPVLKYSLWGIYGGITDAAPAAGINLSAWKQPLPVNKANTPAATLFGVSTSWYGFDFDLANNLVHRNLPGLEDIAITGRAPSGSIVIPDPELATVDFFAKLLNADVGVLNLNHGMDGGSIVGISSSYVQITSVDYEDKDKACALKLGLKFLHSDAGNDDLILLAK